MVVDVYVDGGIAKADAAGGLYMAMCWLDNSYYLPNYRAQAKICFTNTTARTSMRAPGVVQSCLCTEVIIERVARELCQPITTIQQTNFISDGQLTILGQPITHCTMATVWATLMERSRCSERTARVEDFNKSSLWRKRGISCCPG